MGLSKESEIKIFDDLKRLVKKEKVYTYRILKHLMIIERDKLYSDLRYQSLHSYLVFELKYTENEATVRVNAVRLMLKSPKALKNIEQGELTLTNASKANQLVQELKINCKKELDVIVEKAAVSSKRQFQTYIAENYRRARREILVLDERTLVKLDKYRKVNKCGDLSSYEVFQILLEKELNSFKEFTRDRSRRESSSISRYIPLSVRKSVNDGKCNNCGKKWDLEYDHIHKFSHGGTNEASNIQMLCRNCNQRKEIKSRQKGIFA